MCCFARSHKGTESDVCIHATILDFIWRDELAFFHSQDMIYYMQTANKILVHTYIQCHHDSLNNLPGGIAITHVFSSGYIFSYPTVTGTGKSHSIHLVNRFLTWCNSSNICMMAPTGHKKHRSLLSRIEHLLWQFSHILLALKVWSNIGKSHLWVCLKKLELTLVLMTSEDPFHIFLQLFL